MRNLTAAIAATAILFSALVANATETCKRTTTIETDNTGRTVIRTHKVCVVTAQSTATK